MIVFFQNYVKSLFGVFTTDPVRQHADNILESLHEISTELWNLRLMLQGSWNSDFIKKVYWQI